MLQLQTIAYERIIFTKGVHHALYFGTPEKWHHALYFGTEGVRDDLDMGNEMKYDGSSNKN